MSVKPELALLLEGVESAEARERIVTAYHSLSRSDPDGFAVQFAILGAAIASRIERSVIAAQLAVAEAAKLDHSPDAIADRVLKDVPHFRDMKQLADSIKVAVSNFNGAGKGRGIRWWEMLGLALTVVNTAILLVFRGMASG